MDTETDGLPGESEVSGLLRAYDSLLTSAICDVPAGALVRCETAASGLPFYCPVTRPLVRMFLRRHIAGVLDELTKRFARRVAIGASASSDAESLSAVETFTKGVDDPSTRRFALLGAVTTIGLAWLLASLAFSNGQDGDILSSLLEGAATLDTAKIADASAKVDIQHGIGIVLLLLLAAWLVALLPSAAYYYTRALLAAPQADRRPQTSPLRVDAKAESGTVAVERRVFANLGVERASGWPFDLAFVALFSVVPVWALSMLMYFVFAARRGAIAGTHSWHQLILCMVAVGVAILLVTLRFARLFELWRIRSRYSGGSGLLGGRTVVAMQGAGLIFVFVVTVWAIWQVELPGPSHIHVSGVRAGSMITREDFLGFDGRSTSRYTARQLAEEGITFAAHVDVVVPERGNVRSQWVLSDAYGTHDEIATLVGPTFKPTTEVRSTDHAVTSKQGLMLIDFSPLAQRDGTTESVVSGTSRVWVPFKVVVDHPLDAVLELIDVSGRVTRAALTHWSPIVD